MATFGQVAKADGSQTGNVVQTIIYYPFGDVYGDAWLNASAKPYKYNGKELNRMHGQGWYD